MVVVFILHFRVIAVVRVGVIVPLAGPVLKLRVRHLGGFEVFVHVLKAGEAEARGEVSVGKGEDTITGFAQVLLNLVRHAPIITDDGVGSTI
jgi:hypothetical protein